MTPTAADTTGVISGLVLTLSDDPALRDHAIKRLQFIPHITVGTLVGNRLPIVTEAQSESEAKQVMKEIQAEDGILFVDLISVYYDDENDTPHHQPKNSSTSVSVKETTHGSR